jgi:replicative DNA helicase
MNRLFRSVIQIGSVPDEEDALQNWNRLQEHIVEFDDEEGKKVFDYLVQFYSQMNSPPDFSLVREFFEKQDEIEVLEKLEDIKKSQHYIRTNFLAILKTIVEQQQVKNFILACRDAQTIAEHGRNLNKPIEGKKILKGVNDAVNFIYSKLSDFTRIEAGTKLEGVVSEDSEEFIGEYDKISAEGNFTDRNLFGLEPVDVACMGHRRGEYWIHAGFSGELKTTLALNYAYNNVMVYGRNIFYAILEMPYEQLRRQLYVIHSSNGKFVTDWHKEDGYTGLDYRKVRDGMLSDRDYKRLKIVAQDFKATAKGTLYVWRPDDEVTLSDIKRRAEMFHNKYDCDGIIIDHLGLVRPKRTVSDYVVSLNNTVRETRLLALNFARGRAVPLLALFQINRQGKMRADKNDGRYDYASIAYANEAEKSADVITYTYLNDQLRKDGKFFLGCLKNRDNPLFERMIGKIIWQSKRMRALENDLIDFDNDRIVSASKRITNLTTSDLLS